MPKPRDLRQTFWKPVRIRCRRPHRIGRCASFQQRKTKPQVKDPHRVQQFEVLGHLVRCRTRLQTHASQQQSRQAQIADRLQTLDFRTRHYRGVRARSHWFPPLPQANSAQKDRPAGGAMRYDLIAKDLRSPLAPGANGQQCAQARSGRPCSDRLREQTVAAMPTDRHPRLAKAVWPQETQAIEHHVVRYPQSPIQARQVGRIAEEQ